MGDTGFAGALSGHSVKALLLGGAAFIPGASSSKEREKLVAESLEKKHVIDKLQAQVDDLTNERDRKAEAMESLPIPVRQDISKALSTTNVCASDKNGNCMEHLTTSQERLGDDASTTPSFTVSGSGCTLKSDGCVSSLNFPGTYGSNEQCTITAASAGTLSVSGFSTESSYDKLFVGADKYEGSSGPNGVQVIQGTQITWSTDHSAHQTGFELCLTTPSPTEADATAENKGGNGCTPSAPCGIGGGDCDTDSDCESGLLCFQRSIDYGELVPGVISNPDLTPDSYIYAGMPDNYDICYKPGACALHDEPPQSALTTMGISAQWLPCLTTSSNPYGDGRCTSCNWGQGALMPIADFWSDASPTEGRCQGWGLSCDQSAMCYHDQKAVQAPKIYDGSDPSFACAKNCKFQMQLNAPSEVLATAAWASRDFAVTSDMDEDHYKRAVVTCKLYKTTKCQPDSSVDGEDGSRCEVSKKATCLEVCRMAGYKTAGGAPTTANCMSCECDNAPYGRAGSEWCKQAVAMW